MESPNVAHVPLNLEGALELGLDPCHYCYAGWGTVNSSGIIHSCKDSCDYYKRYRDLPAVKKMQMTSLSFTLSNNTPEVVLGDCPHINTYTTTAGEKCSDCGRDLGCKF